MTPLKLRGFLALFLAGSLAGIAAMTALPHDKYLRYQALNDGTAPTAYWIYERIHDDPTPIDIAFIGTSRTGLSVHTRRLEQDMAAEGVVAHAVNFHIVKDGVNMQYAVAKELLATRKVKILVIEILEREDRKPHPDFIYLADVADVLTAPAFVNFNYFSDIARLPGRQLDLFIQTESRRFGLRADGHFPPPYEGPNLDHAESIRTLDGVVHARDDSHTKAQMEALRIEQERAITPPLLPMALDALEFRIPRYYMDRILQLAAAHNTSVVFLYTPRYGGPAQPPPYLPYAGRFDLINPWPQLQEPGLWSDVTHVNWEGAKRLTDVVAADLAGRKELR